MITISIYGLDQYTVGHYSKEHTDNIASLFETTIDNILFCAPNNYVFHNGVEQTSWNAIIRITAPEKFQPLEQKVSKYLIETLKEFTIHLLVEFNYVNSKNQYLHINKEYPRFITEENVVNVEDYNEDEELYEGNIFEGMEKKLEEAYKQEEKNCDCHNHHCDNDCNCDCECDDDCDCDGECHCEHKH